MSDKIGLDETGAALRDMRLEDLPGYLATTADTRVSKDNISVIIIEANMPAQGPALRPPAQERAYVGYNSRWSKTLDSAVAAAVAPAGAASSGGSSGGGKKVLIGIVAVVAVLAVIGILAVLLGGQGRNTGAPVATAAIDATEPAAAVTEAADTATPTDTPVPTETPTPTDTPTPTATLTPSETPVPPTATLRAIPSATVRPG